MLRQFLRDFGGDWVGLVSGIASFVLAFIAAINLENLPAWVIWPTAYVCLAVSAYRVWAREHLTHVETEKRLTGEVAEARRISGEALAQSKGESAALQARLDERRASLGDIRDFVRKRLAEARPILDDNREKDFAPWIDRCQRFADAALLSNLSEQFRKATHQQGVTDRKRFGKGMDVLGTWTDRLTDGDIKSTITVKQLSEF